MSNASYEIGDVFDAPEERPRIVTLCHKESEGSGTVLIKVNGVTVAGFYEGFDHLEIFNPQTETTGLVKGEGSNLLEVK